MQTVPVGQLQLTILNDGAFPFPARLFFCNVAETAWRAELELDLEGKIPVGHNYGLVRSGEELIVIDTGYGDDTHGGRTGHLLEELEHAGYRREQVTKVVNTHAHGDHTSRNMLAKKGKLAPAFPNARYYLAQADWDRFIGEDGQVHHFDQNLRALAGSGMLTLFEGPMQLTPEVSLLPTPGHTPGHTSVVMESSGQTAIYLGDLCHHPLHFSHPDWVSCFDTDPKATAETRAWVFEMAIARNALVVCPHAQAPGLGRIRRAGTGFIWKPI